MYYTCIHINIYIYADVCICAYLYIYICLYIYKLSVVIIHTQSILFTNNGSKSRQGRLETMLND
jgi:hypothetical protein